MKKNRLILLGLMIGVMASFAACGKAKEPTSASELYNQVKDKDSSNAHFEGSMNLKIEAKAQGMTLEIPIDLTMTGDTTKAGAHMNMDLSMEMMGEQTKENMELYAELSEDQATTYVKSGEDAEWISSTVDGLKKMTDKKLNEEMMAKASFTKEDDGSGYTIGMSLKDLFESESFQQLMGDALAENGVTEDETSKAVFDALGACVINCKYDKDLNPVEVYMKDVDINLNMPLEGMEMEMAIRGGMDFNFSQHGSIKDEAVKVPDAVKANASSAAEGAILPTEGGEADGSVEETTEEATEEAAGNAA